MGEGVVSRAEMAEREDGTEMNDGGREMRGRSSAGVVKWERFLPRMVLRVLLVEADDSTRQIITALLRKCNYKGEDSCLELTANSLSSISVV